MKTGKKTLHDLPQLILETLAFDNNLRHAKYVKIFDLNKDNRQINYQTRCYDCFTAHTTAVKLACTIAVRFPLIFKKLLAFALGFQRNTGITPIAIANTELPEITHVDFFYTFPVIVTPQLPLLTFTPFNLMLYNIIYTDFSFWHNLCFRNGRVAITIFIFFS